MYSENSVELSGDQDSQLPLYEPEPLHRELKTPKIRGEGQIKLDTFAQIIGHLCNYVNNNPGAIIDHKKMIRFLRTFNDLFYRSHGMNMIFDELDSRLTTVISGVGVQTLFVEDIFDEEVKARAGRGIV